MTQESPIIDDLKQDPPCSTIGTDWQLFTDLVMGGLSIGKMLREEIAGRSAIHMQGSVSLENNGGFIQISLDLAQECVFDARGWSGIEIDVYGPDNDYELRLRTSDLSQPWQSYRHSFRIEPHWRTIQLPFYQFRPHRTEKTMDISKLRRLGLVAIGRAFDADLALSGIRLFA